MKEHRNSADVLAKVGADVPVSRVSLCPYVALGTWGGMGALGLKKQFC